MWEKESMKNITIRLDDELIEKIKIMAKKESRTLSAMIRKILKDKTE